MNFNIKELNALISGAFKKYNKLTKEIILKYTLSIPKEHNKYIIYLLGMENMFYLSYSQINTIYIGASNNKKLTDNYLNNENIVLSNTSSNVLLNFCIKN